MKKQVIRLTAPRAQLALQADIQTLLLIHFEFVSSVAQDFMRQFLEIKTALNAFPGNCPVLIARCAATARLENILLTSCLVRNVLAEPTLPKPSLVSASIARQDSSRVPHLELLRARRVAWVPPLI